MSDFNEVSAHVHTYDCLAKTTKGGTKWPPKLICGKEPKISTKKLLKLLETK